MSPPPKPPRPPQSSDSDRPISAGDRELVLRVVQEVEERMVVRMQETERRLAEELRRVLHSEREQDRRLFDLDTRVRELASREGRDAGEMSGRAVAREETKHTKASTTLIAIFIAAVTSGITQGLVKAFEPVKPPAAPLHSKP